MNMIRVELPYHLRNLAGVDREVTLEVDGPATQQTLLDALENRYPALRGTIRDHTTMARRPLIRFYACNQDISHVSPHDLLPEAVAIGKEPLIILGAVAGG